MQCATNIERKIFHRFFDVRDSQEKCIPLKTSYFSFNITEYFGEEGVLLHVTSNYAKPAPQFFAFLFIKIGHQRSCLFSTAPVCTIQQYPHFNSCNEIVWVPGVRNEVADAS